MTAPPLDAAFAALPLPAAVFDATGRFAALNEAAEIWLNLSSRSVAGLAPDDPALFSRLRVPADLPSLIGAVRPGEDSLTRPRMVFQIGDRAGGWQMRRASLHLAALPAGGAVAVIRPEDAADAAPRHGARTAIGMAEMLAHEIRNPLAGIRGAAQLLAGGLTPEDRELADLIVAESRRIVALLDRVERFGDTSAPRMAAVNVHDVLDRARRSFELSGQAPGIVTDYDPSLPPARADADALVQLVLNLLRNAAEALARGPCGAGIPLIRIRTAYDGAMRGADGAPLPLQVEIEDNGPGIPDSIAEQVFEPFISTRPNGTGLGLALAGKIATDHGARLAVDSRPGRTLFRLSLPKIPPGEDRWTAPS